MKTVLFETEWQDHKNNKKGSLKNQLHFVEKNASHLENQRYKLNQQIRFTFSQ